MQLYIIYYLSMDFIQLRTDARTVPTPQIRQFILKSSSGVWQYDEDDNVKQLQSYVAEYFGKQDAAFVISGVFANQLAFLTHSQPGDELIIRDKTHTIRNQNGSLGLIARVITKTVECPKQYITPQILTKVIRRNKDKRSPKTKLVMLQFPTFQGNLPTTQQFQQCCSIAQKEDLIVHVDAARIFNGLAEIDISPKQFFKNASSLMFCLSKICCPLGAMLVGSKDFIRKAKENRTMMGGELCKPGIMAGACLYALKNLGDEPKNDNKSARLLAKQLNQLSWIEVAQIPMTNMVYFRFTDPKINWMEIKQYMANRNIQLFLTTSTGLNRIVCHRYIREPQIKIVIQEFNHFYSKFEK